MLIEVGDHHRPMLHGRAHRAIVGTHPRLEGPGEERRLTQKVVDRYVGKITEEVQAAREPPLIPRTTKSSRPQARGFLESVEPEPALIALGKHAKPGKRRS